MKHWLSIILILFSMQVSISAQPCLPDGIVFTTQAQIDSFQINYPNCKEITGGARIQGTDITNLSGLSEIISMGGIFV